jgi:hypothetical protein
MGTHPHFPHDGAHKGDTTMKKHALPILGATLGAALLAFVTPLPLRADDEGGCSNRTLRGSYGFDVDGQILPPGAPALILRGVAMTQFDGAGNLSQVDHATLNGLPRWAGWRSAVGTYDVNPDCTGTAQIIPSDGSPVLNLHLVVFDRGRQVRTVVDGNATGSLGVRVR